MSTAIKLDRETAQVVREVLEYRILDTMETTTHDPYFDHFDEARRIARVLVESVGFSGTDRDEFEIPAGVAERHVIITAARWEDDLGDDRAENTFERGERPEFVAFHRARAEKGRAVLALLGAERGNPYHLAAEAAR